MRRSFHVIIVAAGSGVRLGAQLPKQYINLGGKPILRRTIESFQTVEGLGRLCVVINPDHKTMFDEAVEGLENIEFCYGGNERFNSVNNGLDKFSDLNNEDVILIHDAARPFVRQDDINHIIDVMKDYDAATLGVKAVDTLRYGREEGICTSFVDRNGLWAIQTPQAFKYGLLKTAHDQAKNGQNYSDDTALLSDMGVDVKLIEAHKINFKITTYEDLQLAERLIASEMQNEIRVGQGFDVHAFDEDEHADHVILCGVSIPHHCKLKGHSDADVGFHALTDAILGAIGEGDIGLHFPPSDDSFKNMDSAVFLKKSMDLLRDKGGRLVNADVTLICEAPKIGPHRDTMIARMSEVLSVSQNRINIKATTTEKLGFTGRKEGIAAQASVSVSVPCTINE